MDMASKSASSVGTLVSSLLLSTLNYTVYRPRCRSGSLSLCPKQDIGCSSCRQYVFTSSIDRSLTWSTNIFFYLRYISQPSCTQHLAWPLVPTYLTFMKYNTREPNVLECETSNLGNVSFPHNRCGEMVVPSECPNLLALVAPFLDDWTWKRVPAGWFYSLFLSRFLTLMLRHSSQSTPTLNQKYLYLTGHNRSAALTFEGTLGRIAPSIISHEDQERRLPRTLALMRFMTVE